MMNQKEVKKLGEITLPQSKNLAELLSPQLIKNAQMLGEGSHGIVLHIGTLAVKIGFHLGFEDKISKIIADIAYPNKIGPRARVKKQLSDTLEGPTGFEKQVLAHMIGNKVCPQLIDAHAVAPIVYKGKICGMTLPVYTGIFMSLHDKRFRLTNKERVTLETAGVQIDDFQHQKNGVILLNGQRRIFDITLRAR